MLRRIYITTSAGLTAGTLMCAPLALAQTSVANQSDIVLQGEGLGLNPLEGLSLDLAAPTQVPVSQDAQVRADADREAFAQNLAEGSTPSTSTLPWYQQFTVAPSEGLNASWAEDDYTFTFESGNRWRFTVGFDDSGVGSQFTPDDVSAGAFFNFNERLSLGGEFRFTSPEDDIFRLEGEETESEVKFESAFKF